MKKPWARRAIGAGIALAIGVAMTGCGSSGGANSGAVAGDGEYDGPAVDITFWHGWTGGAAPVIVGVGLLVAAFGAGLFVADVRRDRRVTAAES